MTLKNSNGERMCGPGVQYGDHAAAALKQTPLGSFVAHLVLGFDGGLHGQQYSKTSSTPGHVQCGNSNSGSRDNATFLLFPPYPTAPTRRARKSAAWRAVQMDVKQQVCTFQLNSGPARVLEPGPAYSNDQRFCR